VVCGLLGAEQDGEFVSFYYVEKLACLLPIVMITRKKGRKRGIVSLLKIKRERQNFLHLAGIVSHCSRW
jgi:hypothetical protein